MSDLQRPPSLKPGDIVRYILDRDHIETVDSVRWVAAAARPHWRVVTRWDGACRVADAAEFVIEGVAP
jgi:hypothetical protein